MKAIFKIPERAIGNRYYYCKRRETDYGPILTYPERLNDIHNFEINVVPSFSKILGDYKFNLPDDDNEINVYWVFKEFIKLDYTLNDKDLEIEI